MRECAALQQGGDGGARSSSSTARFKKRPWTLEEDDLLLAFVRRNGPNNWSTARRLFPDLNRSGKSCRLRYMNQLHPSIRRTSISPAEVSRILKYHFIFGNQWSRIASMVPGRTDNTIKNIVNMRLKRARRHAASIDMALRAAAMAPSEHQLCFAASSTMDALLETCINMPSPSLGCGVSALVLPSRVATSMEDAWLSSASSSPLACGAGAPVMNLGMMGAGMNLHSHTAGPDMSFSSSMSLLPPPEQTLMQQLPTVQLNSFEELPLLHNQSFTQLPSVQTQSFQVTSLQQPLQSLEGSELPSVHGALQSVSISSESPLIQKVSQSVSSELPTVEMEQEQQQQQQQARMFYHCSEHAWGDNDLLEAIKLTGGVFIQF